MILQIFTTLRSGSESIIQTSIEVPCKGYFAGGPTPGACCKAMVQGFKEYATSIARK